MEKGKPEKFLYLKLIGILTIPLLLITFYSFSDKEIQFNEVILNKAPIKKYFSTSNSSSAFINKDTITIEEITDSLPSFTRDTTSQRILLIGDSMLEGISKRIKAYAGENNHELLSVIWYSSSTKIWAESDTLTHFISNFSPTYVFICLGGNELFVRDLDKRENYINTIVTKIDTIPYIWIGPPNWKEDTGINELIEKRVGKSRYFPSKNLTYQRASDGAHPTMASAAKWADSIVVWMDNEASHRIQMKFPPKGGREYGKNVLLMPVN